MNKIDDEIRFRLLWKLGIVICFLVYWTGIYAVYIFTRKNIQKKYRNIILTYHRVRDDNQDPDISVNGKNFEKQIEYLKKNYNIVPLGEVLNSFVNEKGRRRDNLALTLDDGYKDNYELAYQVLKRNNAPATIFLISKFVGHKDFVSIDDIKEMTKNRIEFGSHTRTHKILSEIEIKEAEDEIVLAKTELETLLNREIEFFAYPKGKRKHFNRQIKQMVKESGYKAAFASENGAVDASIDQFEIRRIGIRNCPMFVFKVRISGFFESSLLYYVRRLLRLT